jgi:hypothetical protein
MNAAVYLLFAQLCPVILVWLMVFLAVTVVTLIWRAAAGRQEAYRDTLVGGELPGILLVLTHSVCFGYSLYLHDWPSAIVFGWWGPGFLVVATLVLAKRKVDWRRIALATSISCKLNYLLLVALFFHFGCSAPIYAYSLWIMHDQIRLAWLQKNADRTRRVSEDWWLPRLCYPGFLVLPFFDASIPFRWLCAGVSVLVALLWIWGILRLVRQGCFRERPRSFTHNLRDIVYLRKMDAVPASG